MKMKQADKIPYLVFADTDGKIYDTPYLKMLGRWGRDFQAVTTDDLIPLPEGSELFIMPERIPVGWNEERERTEILYENPDKPGQKIFAVAAFMAPAHTMTCLAAYHKIHTNSPPLPLFAYSAVGWWKGRFWTTGFRSDPDQRQDFRNFDLKMVKRMTIQNLKKYRDNRLIQHLGKCCLTYGCPAAKNFFLKRWEAPIPTSPICNARCIGCISEQEPGGPPATQDRIKFVPSVKEICDLAVPHLEYAKKAIVSFGQGCEGEPLLQGKSLANAIKEIRKKTEKGTINLNTNGSRPEVVESLIHTGLDSMRISMNSVRESYYSRYYRPKGYNQKDVLSSWEIMKKEGRFLSINLFVMPGLTDQEEELERLSDLIEQYGLDIIQLRNHNIDPDWYLDQIDFEKTREPLGIKEMIKELKKRFPNLRFGYFNPPLQ